MGRENKICFTDIQGKTLFAVSDGGMIRLGYGNGDEAFAVCRYLDETHAEIDGVPYALSDFAGRSRTHGTKPNQLRPCITAGQAQDKENKEVHHTWLRNTS